MMVLPPHAASGAIIGLGFSFEILLPLYYSQAQSTVVQKSMRLKYEPASEPLGLRLSRATNSSARALTPKLTRRELEPFPSFLTFPHTASGNIESGDGAVPDPRDNDCRWPTLYTLSPPYAHTLHPNPTPYTLTPHPTP